MKVLKKFNKNMTLKLVCDLLECHRDVKRPHKMNNYDKDYIQSLLL